MHTRLNQHHDFNVVHVYKRKGEKTEPLEYSIWFYTVQIHGNNGKRQGDAKIRS